MIVALLIVIILILVAPRLLGFLILIGAPLAFVTGLLLLAAAN